MNKWGYAGLACVVVADLYCIAVRLEEHAHAGAVSHARAVAVLNVVRDINGYCHPAGWPDECTGPFVYMGTLARLARDGIAPPVASTYAGAVDAATDPGPAGKPGAGFYEMVGRWHYAARLAGKAGKKGS